LKRGTETFWKVFGGEGGNWNGPLRPEKRERKVLKRGESPGLRNVSPGGIREGLEKRSRGPTEIP